jgi:hypothetical protein
MKVLKRPADSARQMRRIAFDLHLKGTPIVNR